MYHGRYRSSGSGNVKKKHKKLNVFFLVTLSLVLLLSTFGSYTLAFVLSQSAPVQNTFVPVAVRCSVQDNYQVKNTGDIPAYIRAAVVVNWENEAGQINGIAPVLSTDGVTGDYTIELGAGWKKVGEYYYYDTGSVEVDKLTTTPVCIVSQLENANPPAGFTLSVEIAAEAIQANGMGASSAQDAWAKVLPATGNG